MKTSASACNKQTSSLKILNEYDDDDDELSDFDVKISTEYSDDILYRILTLPDIHQALNTLEIYQKLSQKRTFSSDSDISTMLPEQNTQSTIECNCCRLVRSDKSARLLLPLARRGRPHISSRSHRLLCKNCLKIKRKQQNDILQNQHETNTKTISEAMTALNRTSDDENKHQMIVQDFPHEIDFSLINDNDKIHLNNSEYEASQMLVWKINTSDNQNQTNAINASYDTGSLTDNERKILLQEAVQKLQIVLSNRSTSTTSIPDSDLDQIEFTYRALQTTVNILSSSLDSL